MTKSQKILEILKDARSSIRAIDDNVAIMAFTSCIDDDNQSKTTCVAQGSHEKIVDAINLQMQKSIQVYKVINLAKTQCDISLRREIAHQELLLKLDQSTKGVIDEL